MFDVLTPRRPEEVVVVLEDTRERRCLAACPAV